MKNIWRAVQFIPAHRSRTGRVLMLGLLTSLVGTSTPYIYKAMVDVIAKLATSAPICGQAASSVVALLGLFLGVRVAIVVLVALQQREADSLWLDTISTFRQRVFENTTRLSIDYFEKTRAGEIMDRFGAITTMTTWLSSFVDGALSCALQIIFSVAALLWRARLVGVIMSIAVLVNLTISIRSARWTKPHRRGWQELSGRIAGLLGEMIGNISTVRSFGGEVGIKQRYHETEAGWRAERGSLHRIQWWSSLALGAVNAIGVFLAVAVTARGALRGHLTPGDILFVLTLSQIVISAIGPVTRQINQTADVDTSAERLVELLEVETELADRDDAVELDELRTVEFQHVSFSYRGKAVPALSDVSFVLCAGETLALVGPSGGGKTTVVKLLMRFYDPSAGSILINGRNLREYTQRSVRARMGVVLQDVALLNDTVGENIALARSGASTHDVHSAACAAHADDFIQSLPGKYDTLVGERGIKLSGGEKQRVAIARAILKDPDLIVLDEATSGLDSESERLVQQGLVRLLQRRSSVIIAHRLSTVISADQILVLNEGRVVEHGRHTTLAAVPGSLYAKLCALQNNGHFAEASSAPVGVANTIRRT